MPIVITCPFCHRVQRNLRRDDYISGREIVYVEFSELESDGTLDLDTEDIVDWGDSSTEREEGNYECGYCNANLTNLSELQVSRMSEEEFRSIEREQNENPPEPTPRRSVFDAIIANRGSGLGSYYRSPVRSAQIPPDEGSEVIKGIVDKLKNYAGATCPACSHTFSLSWQEIELEEYECPRCSHVFTSNEQ